jgi:site-specific recombinase XerD
LTSAKLFATFLYQQKIISVNVAERIKNFKTDEGHAKDALEANTVKKILANLKTSTLGEKRDAAIFASMVCCGLRDIEVVRANVDDMVNRGEKIFLYLQGKGRDDKGDCVELPQGVYRLIQVYLAERKAITRITETSPLFASVSNRNNDGRLTTTSISRLIKGILRDNGIDSKRVTSHSLRHTCATVMLQNGVELRKVQEVLRHKSVTVTERYLHDLKRYNNNGESIAAAAFGLD